MYAFIRIIIMLVGAFLIVNSVVTTAELVEYVFFYNVRFIGDFMTGFLLILMVLLSRNYAVDKRKYSGSAGDIASGVGGKKDGLFEVGIFDSDCGEGGGD